MHAGIVTQPPLVSYKRNRLQTTIKQKRVQTFVRR